jgi:hypothetical protein
MYDGIDVIQTWDIIKILCKSVVDKFCEKYLIFWMQKFTGIDNQPMPLPTEPTWLKSLMLLLVIQI